MMRDIGKYFMNGFKMVAAEEIVGKPQNHLNE